jgi:hypothetical protein
MKSLAYCVTLLSTIAISIAAGLPAQAQRARVFVSVTGNDANPCTAGSPCKTFQVAHDAVLAGGEISVLDTGGYGTLIINKAVSIVAVGVQASIAIPSGANGVTINAGASDRISLRGLTLDGSGVGGSGIVFNSGAALEMADCVVRNFTSNAIDFIPPQASSSLALSNTVISDSGAGVLIAPTGFTPQTITATLNRVEMRNNSSSGLHVSGQSTTAAAGTINVSVVDSVLANNDVGIDTEALDISRSRIQVSLFHSAVSNNGTFGILAEGQLSTIRFSETLVTGNQDAWSSHIGGLVLSYGNNFIDGNSNVSNAPATIPMK